MKAIMIKLMLIVVLNIVLTNKIFAKEVSLKSNLSFKSQNRVVVAQAISDQKKFEQYFTSRRKNFGGFKATGISSLNYKIEKKFEKAKRIVLRKVHQRVAKSG